MKKEKENNEKIKVTIMPDNELNQGNEMVFYIDKNCNINSNYGYSFELLKQMEDLVSVNNGSWIEWNDGNATVGFNIPKGESCLTALEMAIEELEDPNISFDETVNEDLARTVIPWLHLSLLRCNLSNYLPKEN